MIVLEREEWQARASSHRARLGPFVEAHRARRGRGEKHPVHDFLFDYYSFRGSLLLTWSPGIGVFCRDFGGIKCLSQGENGVFIDARQFPSHRVEGLRETLDILRQTALRPPFYGCNGLHEWAMVYRETEHRHNAPLRLSASQIAELIETQPIRCSHYDAFRFFTPPAHAFNLLNPQADMRAEFEQPGCIHANMDLYKWATKFYPFVGSDLIAGAFELARAAREIDMRAAPYDLLAFGFEPIRVETSEGRREYAALQRQVAECAAPIRARLIAVMEALLAGAESVGRELTGSSPLAEW